LGDGAVLGVADRVTEPDGRTRPGDGGPGGDLLEREVVVVFTEREEGVAVVSLIPGRTGDRRA
jgi:hypothetical protein